MEGNNYTCLEHLGVALWTEGLVSVRIVTGGPCIHFRLSLKLRLIPLQ